MKKCIFILAVSMVLVMALSSAALGVGARALGMGGAFTALADGPSAAYWNPAGLTQTRIVNLGLNAEAPLNQDYNFILDAINSGGSTLTPPTNPFHANLNGYATLQFKFSAVSLFYTSEMHYYDNGSTIAYSADLGSSYYGTIAFGLLGVSVGGNIKYINRQYRTYDVSATGGNEYITTDQGLGFDLGALVKFLNKVHIGVKIENIATTIDRSGTHTTYPSMDEEPYKQSVTLPMTANLGVAFKPAKDSTLAFDIHGVNLSSTGTNDNLSYHLGFEQKLAIFALRCGYQTAQVTVGSSSFTDSAFSAGIGIDAIFGAIDLAAKMPSNGGTVINATAMIKI